MADPIPPVVLHPARGPRVRRPQRQNDLSIGQICHEARAKVRHRRVHDRFRLGHGDRIDDLRDVDALPLERLVCSSVPNNKFVLKVGARKVAELGIVQRLPPSLAPVIKEGPRGRRAHAQRQDLHCGLWQGGVARGQRKLRGIRAEALIDAARAVGVQFVEAVIPRPLKKMLRLLLEVPSRVGSEPEGVWVVSRGLLLAPVLPLLPARPLESREATASDLLLLHLLPPRLLLCGSLPP
mmetsp:Transcript_53906/g.131788  ORF Transcript_53906/g.131788 Transcript_53906/m.131788 type:complete len:238 (+) Transcript_53906:385-1098(+)